MDALALISTLVSESPSDADNFRQNACTMLAEHGIIDTNIDGLARAVADTTTGEVNPFTVFSDVWQPSLNTLPDADLHKAWRLADYAVVPRGEAFVQDVVQRVARRFISLRSTRKRKATPIEKHELCTALFVGLSPDEERQVNDSALMKTIAAELEKLRTASFSDWQVIAGTRTPVAGDELVLAAAWNQWTEDRSRRVARYSNHVYPFSSNNHVHNSIREATRHGHLDVVSCIYSLLCENFKRAAAGLVLRHAIETGNIAMLEWGLVHDFQQPHFDISRGLMRQALLSGRVNIAQRLKQHGIPEYVDADYAAIRSGKLEMLQWVCAEGVVPEPPTCALAAECGHLDMLKWLRGRTPQCEWDAHTPWSAARYGRLDVLQWVIANGCDMPLAANQLIAKGERVGVYKVVFGNDNHTFDQKFTPFQAHIVEWMKLHVATFA